MSAIDFTCSCNLFFMVFKLYHQALEGISSLLGHPSLCCFEFRFGSKLLLICWTLATNYENNKKKKKKLLKTKKTSWNPFLKAQNLQQTLWLRLTFHKSKWWCPSKGSVHIVLMVHFRVSFQFLISTQKNIYFQKNNNKHHKSINSCSFFISDFFFFFSFYENWA